MSEQEIQRQTVPTKKYGFKYELHDRFKKLIEKRFPNESFDHKNHLKQDRILEDLEESCVHILGEYLESMKYTDKYARAYCIYTHRDSDGSNHLAMCFYTCRQPIPVEKQSEVEKFMEERLTNPGNVTFIIHDPRTRFSIAEVADEHDIAPKYVFTINPYTSKIQPYGTN